MAARRPILGELELQLVQKIETEGDQDLEQHSVPALDGDFFQIQGRRATRITLTGAVVGEEAAQSLADLRRKFDEGQPTTFVSDISTATQVDEVLLEEMGVRELAGRPQRFEYALTLREYTEASPPPIEPIIIPPRVLQTCLEIQVVVEGRPDFDHSNTVVTVRNLATNEIITPDRIDNDRWLETPIDPGEYLVEAVTQAPESMSGSTTQEVLEGQCPVAVVTLRPASVGNAYVVHYRFDKAFVEPCMRHVLAEVAGRVSSGASNEKALIVGHTDLTGSDEYNQSLSERRARSVFAFLTYGIDSAAAVNEWDELRKTRTVGSPTMNDTWGARQYQYMLQDLGFYSANVDGDHGPATSAGVRDFQRSVGLPQTGSVDDATWRALIDAYLRKSSFAVPNGKFLGACPGEPLKWLGAGEKDWVQNTQLAHRPNRRTEVIFTTVSQLPCEVPEPDTWQLPDRPSPRRDWCLGPGSPNRRFCFLKREGPQQEQKQALISPNAILVSPADPRTTTVTVRMEFDDGRPAPNIRYVLIAPDGEFMDGESQTSGTRGTGIEGRTGPDGSVTYAKQKGVGVYTLEVKGPFVARLKGQTPDKAKGNVVCKRLNGSEEFEVILTPGAASLEFVDTNDADRELDRVVWGQPFRLRADLPGETRDEITIEVTSYLIRR